MVDLKYTICFCVSSDKVLMLHRKKEPNKGKWNGLGGKIEVGEEPKDSIIREMLEEAGIDLSESQIRLGGVVSWDMDKYDGLLGMYCFVVDLGDEFPIWEEKVKTSEGYLAWKGLDWVINRDNLEVVENIPLFLPKVLANEGVKDYRFVYRKEKLVDWEVLEM